MAVIFTGNVPKVNEPRREVDTRELRRIAEEARRRGALLIPADDGTGTHREAKSKDDVQRFATRMIRHGASEIVAARSMLTSKQFASLLGQTDLLELLTPGPAKGKARHSTRKHAANCR